jgi:ABC-2 type transport system permease protein
MNKEPTRQQIEAGGLRSGGPSSNPSSDIFMADLLRRWGRELGALWAFGVREYRVWQSYRVNQLLWLTNLFATTCLFFLLGKTIEKTAAQALGPAYGTNYMSFIVIGVTVNIFINTNLADPYTRIARSYFNGTMDLYLLSPMSIYTPLLGLMAKSIIDDYPRLFFAGGFGILLFGASFNFSAWLPALGFTALLIGAGFGLGVISASSFYLWDIKKGNEPVQFLIQQLLAQLLAGTYYPISVLPIPLQWLACAIPHTYAFDALRRLLDPNAQTDVAVLPLQLLLKGFSPLAVDAFMLALLSLLLLPLGFYMYGRGIEKARREGTLTRWQ